MKMKNMLIGGMSLALVACISVGGTLAYLTSKTGVMTNTFNFGGFTVTQSETANAEDVGGDVSGNGSNGYTYSKLVPGDIVSKEVKISLDSETGTQAYVYVAVKNSAENLLQYGTKSDEGAFVEGVDTVNWQEVTNQDITGGYKLYVYKGTSSEATPVSSLSEQILFTSAKVIDTDSEQELTDGQTIKIASYAIQADNLEGQEDKAIAYFNNTQNWQ